jgi:uncharacterized protein YegP (UPF0339 family)
MSVPRTPKYEIWRAAPKDWRWHLKAKNGEIVSQGEGYKTRAGASKAVERHRTIAWTASVIHLPAAQ